MAMTHSYKVFVNPAQWLSEGKRTLTTFIDQHTPMFEGLCRVGAPFGGNWLTGRR